MKSLRPIIKNSSFAWYRVSPRNADIKTELSERSKHYHLVTRKVHIYTQYQILVVNHIINLNKCVTVFWTASARPLVGLL